MNSSLVEKIKKFLKERRKNQIQLKINFAFSILTVFMVSYLFIYPAIATTIGFDINKDSLNSLELTTTSSVYMEEENISSVMSSEQFKNELTTTAPLLPEFSSEDTFEREILTQNLISDLAVFPSEEITEIETEPEGLPHILNEDGYITGFLVDGKTQNEDEAIEILNTSVMDWEICYQLPKGILKEGLQKRNTLVYVMDQMRTYSYKEGKILLRETQQNGEEKLTELGVFKIGKDGKEDPSVPEEYKTQENKVFLIFNDEAVKRNETQDFMNGRLGFRSGMLLMQEEEPIKIKVSDTMGALLKSGDRTIPHMFRSATRSGPKHFTIELKGKKIGNGRVHYTAVITSLTGTKEGRVVQIGIRVNKEANVWSLDTNQFIVKHQTENGTQTLPKMPVHLIGNSVWIVLRKMNAGDKYIIDYESSMQNSIIDNPEIPGHIITIIAEALNGDPLEVEETLDVGTDKTNITLKQEWRDLDGNTFLKESGSVIFILGRKLENGEEDVQFSKNYDLNAGNQWEIKVSDLPVQSDDGTKYKYFIKSVQGIPEQYEIMYGNNEQAITEGVLTGIAKAKWMMELPETGGRGRKIHTGGGSILLTLASLIYYLRKKQFLKS